MTTSQFFVYKRPVAWTALVATLLWGGYAYLSMPQRQDPIIPVRVGVVLTAYPGAAADKVEQEVTRKIERKLSQNPVVEKVYSTSRQGLSVVFVELSDRENNAEAIWQDLSNKLQAMSDLPAVGDRQLQPVLDKDFGDTTTVMLTISSPPVAELQIEERARQASAALASFRQTRDAAFRDHRRSAVFFYPTSVPQSLMDRLARSLLARLSSCGLAEDGDRIHAAQACLVDFRLPSSGDDEALARELRDWDRYSLQSGLEHPDMWPGVLVADLTELPARLRDALFHAPDAPGQYTYRELRQFADVVQDRLKQYSRVGKVEQIGAQDEAIYLYYSNARLNALGVEPQSLADGLKQRNINLPGGQIKLPQRNILVQPSGEFRSEREIGEMALDVSQGYPAYLRDLVETVRGYQDPPGVLNYRTVKSGDRNPGDALQPLRSITLAVRQFKAVRISDFDRDLEAALASARTTLPADLLIERTSNEPKEVEHKIHHFNRNLLEAMLVVIVVALIFMEWRSALLVAISIPLTVAMTLGICQIMGVDVQQVSIASMIIALGLLVDDPVVAADAINRELAHGVRRDVAAWQGPQKLAKAILFATLTNCVAFLPLLLIQGQVGEFIWSLPIVVTASLVSSRIVSMTFVPLLGYFLLKGQKGLEAGLAKDGKGSRFARVYNGFTEWCLTHKAVSLAVCLVLLAAGCASLPLIGTAFFPKDLHTVFTVNVFMPEGTPLRHTHAEALEIMRKIDRLGGTDIEAYTTFVGAGGPRFWLSVIPEQRADNYAQILVHTADPTATSRLVDHLKRELPSQVAAARITVEQLESGPPIGVPLQIRLYGADEQRLRALGQEVKSLLIATPGSDNVHDDWDAEVLQIGVQINSDKANLSGLSHQDVATVLHGGLSGYTTTYLRERDRLIPITLRLRPDERTEMADLASLTAVSSRTNARVPVNQFATFKAEMVAPKIARRQHERCLTVKCDAVPGTLPSELVKAIQPTLLKASAAWPAGYRFEFGGEKAEQDKGFASVTVALIVSLIAIYLALVWQFNSVTKPLVVFAAVPFGLVGGMLGLLLFGAPFGFMAFLGVASLAGVIVSHIIVLFDYIEEAQERGESLHRAVIDSALVRLRPVLVTVLATVGGLVPLAVSGGPLWEPLCYVQIAGLLVATLVTKIIVPVLYVLFVENLKLIRWEHSAEVTHHDVPRLT